MCALFERYDPAKDEWVTIASMALYAQGRQPFMLVTALNSAPVIFYPTDTFAELEPWFFSGRQLCMQYRWPLIRCALFTLSV